MRHKAETGNEAGRLVYQLQNDPDRFLAAVQIGITLLGSLASAIGGVIAIEFLQTSLGEGSAAGNQPIQRIPLLAPGGPGHYLSHPGPGGIGAQVLGPQTLREGGIGGCPPIDLFSRFSSPFIRILTSSNRFGIEGPRVEGPRGGTLGLGRPKSR